MILAGTQAGFTCVLACEIEPLCRRVIRHHFPNVPIVEDIHLVDETTCPTKPTLLTGAFPLQANYSRGARRENDPRDLWEEFARCVRELQPYWVVAETLPRFDRIGIDDAMFDLEREGYTTTALVLPAQAFGCPIRKDRLYLVGARSKDYRPFTGEPRWGERPLLEPWPAPGPHLHRVAERSARGVDEHCSLLHAIGDATVPRAAGTILRVIAAVEETFANG